VCYTSWWITHEPTDRCHALEEEIGLEMHDDRD
jgi:hypothetical protein